MNYEFNWGYENIQIHDLKNVKFNYHFRISIHILHDTAHKNLENDHHLSIVCIEKAIPLTISVRNVKRAVRRIWSWQAGL